MNLDLENQELFKERLELAAERISGIAREGLGDAKEKGSDVPEEMLLGLDDYFRRMASFFVLLEDNRRFLAEDALIKQLADNGQIATQYVDEHGEPTNDLRYNPNGSMYAIEGITSPDGRVFGKMGHSERKGELLYKNVPGCYDIKMFEAAVKYFK